VLDILFNLAMRPFRRWWRRLLVAAIVSTVVYPAARQAIEQRVTQRHDTITIPNVP
jgi:hypothetical protein